MSQARRRSDEPPPEPDLAAVLATLDGIARRAGDLLDGAEQVITAAREGLPLPEGIDRRALALLSAGLRHTGGETAGAVRELDRIKLGQVFGQAAESWIRADERQQQAEASRGRHRASRPRKAARGQLELIPGGRTTAAAVALAASVVAGTVGTGAYSDLAHFSPVRAAAHAQAFAGLGPTEALPAPLTPSPSPYVPRHAKPSMNADTARLAPPPPVMTADPAPPEPSAAPSAAPDGTIDVQQFTVVVGPRGEAGISLIAVGGPVSWTASSSSPALDVDGSGTLDSGMPGTIGLRVAPGSLAGSATVTITDGQGNAAQVRVVWAALPLL